jgi:hypothetical protein
MTVDKVWDFINVLQREQKLRQPDVIHDEIELSLELQGREAALNAMVHVFEQRRKSFLETPPPSDRTMYPMVVCSGMKGLGKTRMLEEWPQVFKKAGILEPCLGVFVNYGNGHSAKSFEDVMSIEAAFSWRMLHRLFVEDNYKDKDYMFWSNPHFLPSNAEDLTLEVALRVVRAGAEACGNVGSGQTLSLFVGIDEYQKIPNGPYYSASANDQHVEREKTFLWKLVAALNDYREVSGLHIYPGFAGTRWGPISIGGSSVPGMKRAPLSLLTPQMMEDVVRSSNALKMGLVSPDFRRKLFFLGGIPRPSIKFARGEEFESVWEEYVIEKWSSVSEPLSSAELLRLIAHAVAGVHIRAGDDSGIRGLRWSRLFDEGLCMPLDDEQLGIPYCVFRLAAGIDSETLDSTAFKCLVQNLKYLRDNVDNVLFNVESWQAWEVFGACFFAMRVNALLLLGHEVMEFQRVFRGGVVNGCNNRVCLKPMEIHAIEEELSVKLGAIVIERLNRRKLCWISGDAGVFYCLINGVGGKGVDFFAALPLDGGSGAMMLYNDQRKIVASVLGAKSATNLLEKALILPLCLPYGSKCVRGLFSVLASFNQKENTIPEDCCVLSYRQHVAFHGTLSLHPACKTFVDVNYDNVSTLRLLKSIGNIVDKIVEERKRKFFSSSTIFADFCAANGHNLSEEDILRVVAEA